MNVDEKGLLGPFRAPMRFNGLFSARSVPQPGRSRDHIVAAVALTLIAVLDYVTDVELRVGLFYLVPVVFVAWAVGMRSGVAYACSAAAVSIGRGLIGGHPYAQHIYFCYEVAVTLVILLSASYLVAKLRKTQEELNSLARHDSLTGLANRVSFLERLDLELARHKRTGQPLGVAILDCDNFKAVNDALGHLEGDRLLRASGTTLRAMLRKTDLACRLGGDEFAVLLPETDAYSATKVIEGLIARLNGTIAEGGWAASFSVGVAVFRDAPASAEAALKEADRLMYDVKRGGKHGHKVGVFGVPYGSRRRSAQIEASRSPRNHVWTETDDRTRRARWSVKAVLTEPSGSLPK